MLAALWLERVPDPERALRRFGGDHRFVGEYLSAEVLDGLDDDVREFLLSAAVLGRTTPRLCDAVLERDDSAAMLATLERANLFVVRHERGEWFRIHSLFAEYARVQLVAERPERAADLHRRACAWLQREGLVVEAAEHAAAAGDYDVLARLLDERHLVLIRNGRARTLLRYVRRLPEEVVARHAALAAATATAAAMIGHGTLERRRLLLLADRGRVGLSGADAAYVEATVGMVRAAMVEPDVPRAVESGARAVELAVAGADDVLIAAYGAYARALFFAGDLVASWAAGMVAIEHPAVERRPPGHVFARVSLSLAAAERGHLGSARHHAEKARQIVGRSHGARTWLGANASVAMGVVLAAEGHVEEAERELSHAEHFFRDDVASIHHAWLLLVLARVRLRRGRLDAAAADLWLAQQEEDELADCGIVRPLAQRVAQDLAAAQAQADAGQVTQPPSDAELPVLRLLPSDLSATGIAGVLFLSPNTVRSHMKSLYRKLGVSSRADAVARAEALGLLRRFRFTWVSGAAVAPLPGDRCDRRRCGVPCVHDRRRRRAERRGGHRLRGHGADSRGRQHGAQRLGARPGGAPRAADAGRRPRPDAAQRAGRRVRGGERHAGFTQVKAARRPLARASCVLASAPCPTSRSALRRRTLRRVLASLEPRAFWERFGTLTTIARPVASRGARGPVHPRLGSGAGLRRGRRRRRQPRGARAGDGRPRGSADRRAAGPPGHGVRARPG